MDENSQGFDAKRKSEIEEMLAKIILDAYEKSQLGYEEMKKAAAYILDHIDKIQNNSDLLYFLENLSAYWPIFKKVLTIEKNKTSQKTKEKEIINKLASYIKSSQAM